MGKPSRPRDYRAAAAAAPHSRLVSELVLTSALSSLPRKSRARALAISNEVEAEAARRFAPGLWNPHSDTKILTELATLKRRQQRLVGAKKTKVRLLTLD